MPAYVAGKATSMAPGDLIPLFSAETVAANSQSIAITRSPSPTGSQQPTTFTGSFASTPTATWSVLGANVNTAASYVTLSTQTGNSAFTDTSNYAFLSVIVNTFSAGGAFTCLAHG